MFKKAFILTLCLILALGSVGCSKTPVPTTVITAAPGKAPPKAPHPFGI